VTGGWHRCPKTRSSSDASGIPLIPHTGVFAAK
jgi:hypothetical protein